MKQALLLVARRVNERLPAPPQGLRIGGNHPGAAGHHSGAVIDEQIVKSGIRRPRSC